MTIDHETESAAQSILLQLAEHEAELRIDGNGVVIVGGPVPSTLAELVEANSDVLAVLLQRAGVQSFLAELEAYRAAAIN